MARWSMMWEPGGGFRGRRYIRAGLVNKGKLKKLGRLFIIPDYNSSSRIEVDVLYKAMLVN